MADSNLESLLLKHAALVRDACMVMTRVNETTRQLIAAIEREAKGYPEDKEMLESIAKALAEQNESMQKSVSELMAFSIEDLDEEDD